MSRAALFSSITAAAVLLGALLLVIVSQVRAEVPNRRAVVYSNDGKILKEYSGKIEYVRRGSNGVRFWLDGRRVIIQGGIIVVEDE